MSANLINMLHVDIWWRGQNIALDPGTFAYNAQPPWDNPLSRTAVHNTVGVDRMDQMERAGRFLWLPWLTGKITSRQHGPSGHLAWISGQHDGYRRLRPAVWHRRGVLRIGPEHWLVCDQLESSEPHRSRLHWLLMDVAHQWDASNLGLTLETPAGDYRIQMATSAESPDVSLLRAEPETARGWQAPTYRHRAAALSLALEATGDHVSFWTLLGPSPCSLEVLDEKLIVDSGQSKLTVTLAPRETETLIRGARLQGALEDELTVAS